MSILKKLSGFWRRQGIAPKFGLAFVLLMSLIAVEGIVGILALRSLEQAENVILDSARIRQLVYEMDADLERARRMHRDFFLQYREIGFEAAYAQFVRPALQTLDRVTALSEELRGLIARTPVSDALRRRNVDINLYLSTTRRFAETFQDVVNVAEVLTRPGTGLHDQLEQRTVALAAMLDSQEQTRVLLQEMNTFETRYQLTRKRSFMQSAFNAAFSLTKAIGASQTLTPDEKRLALNLLAEYGNIADRILSHDVNARELFNDFALQSANMDPIARDLKEQTSAEVDAAVSQIGTTRVSAGVLIVLSALGGLGCILLIARVLDLSVTRKVVELTRMAGELRSGNLDARTSVSGRDEFGVLADTFNAMASRMQQLVGNLEERVEERTAELARAKRELEDAVLLLDEKNRALDLQSRTDGLTRLANRFGLDAALKQELQRAQRYGGEFSIILLDVDRFKNVNDTHGHQVGDTVLVQFANVLRSCVRDTDVVGRWGGEEFLLICPGIGLELAKAMAERLRATISLLEFVNAGRITSSLGVTTHVPGDTVQSMLHRADQALYLAKENGRNRVELSLAS